MNAMIADPDFDIGATTVPSPAESSADIARSRKVTDYFPAGLPDREAFSVRMRSCVEISQNGRYRMAISADDGVRLFIDNKLQVDAWDGQALNGIVKAIELDKGVHSLTIEYVNRNGPARLSVRMSGMDPFQRPRSLRNRTAPFVPGHNC